MDAWVGALQVVYLEQSAVEIGDVAQQLRQLGGAVGLGLAEAFVKQPEQEQPVEAVEVAVALPLAHLLQTVAQIGRIVVEKTALLDEVDEHHPVEH